MRRLGEDSWVRRLRDEGARPFVASLALALLGLSSEACGASESAGTETSGGSSGGGGESARGGGGGIEPTDPNADTIPPMVGEPVDDDTPVGPGSGSPECTPDSLRITAVVRDFNGSDEPNGHPDFEMFGGATATLGLVESELGPDRKPVYTGLCEGGTVTAECPSGRQTTSLELFDQWYRNVTGVNLAYEVFLTLEPFEGGLRFQSGQFFPFDDIAWGNQGREHNYHFTTELHIEFKYMGGEVFTFVGDDDVWIFINGKLSVDLGGLHSELGASADLDAMAETLGLSLGGIYSLDVFHAERHTDSSMFRIETNLRFTNCSIVVP